MMRLNIGEYAKSTVVTALKSFPRRSHFLIATPGWEEIADQGLHWAEVQVGTPTAERRGV
ncbi:hypothetical protein [Arenibaculum pallidiluteum]|uniref:hypothetical protein n=1 Tax=Arenibaculum pallidiluteum TaxID=2812559 RepID=UPI001A963570|nr:hypothetical protein [Arenibaculum pallidiluteum]